MKKSAITLKLGNQIQYLILQLKHMGTKDIGKTFTAFIAFLFFVGLINAFNTSQFDFLNQTKKQYCVDNVLTIENAELNKRIYEERTSSMDSWLPDFSSHLVGAIVNLCNRRYQQIQNILYNLVKYTLIHSTPFIFGLFVILILSIAWVYTTFWKHSMIKTQHSFIGQQFTNKTQIALAVFIISLLIVVSISSYGCVKSVQIQKSLNSFWCVLLKQDHGYVRNQTQKSRMIDFSRQLNNATQLITKKSMKIQELFSNLKKNNIFNSAIPTIQNSSFNITKYKDNITKLFTIFKDSFIYYNDTLEFQRQVMVGATFVIGNLDRYGNKYIGYDNISKVFSQGVSYVLSIAMLVCIFSCVMMGYILLKQRPNLMYYKYIIQYLLGFICFICLICALFNSFFSILFHNLRFCLAYEEIGQNPRKQFLQTHTLNDPIVQIIVSFWPHRSGNITHYGKGQFINTLAALQNQLQSLNKLPDPQTKDLGQNESVLSKQIDYKGYKQQVSLLLHQVKALRSTMINPQQLGRLDPTALGRNIYLFIKNLYVNNFNRAYQYRLIFAYISFFLILSLISSIFIDISYKAYSKANEFDHQYQSTHSQKKIRKDSHEMIQTHEDY